MQSVRMMSIALAFLLSACAHDVQSPPQSPHNVMLCVPYTDGSKNPYTGQPVILMKRVTDAADQPVIIIRTSAESAGKTAANSWIRDHPSFTFRGERYFLGPLNVMSLGLPKGVIATLAPIGAVDSVTVYAHERVDFEKPMVLAVRAYSECGIQWYLHVSMVRN